MEKLSFDEALDRWIRMLTAAKRSYYARSYPNTAKREGTEVSFVLDHGKRNVRVVQCEGGERRHVYAFVEQETGKIMKPGGYKAPEPKRYERGNIFRPDPLEGCGPHGVAYRTGGGGYTFRPEDLQAAREAAEER